MTTLRIVPPSSFSSVKISLPTSKSIANRLLIIQACCNRGVAFEAYSDSGDTVLLSRILNNLNPDINAEDAGTVFRFLTAYLSLIPGTWNLTGTQRMCERPIEPLVEALKELGADITYSGKPGFPPLQIKGKRLQGGNVELDASMSSQFVSALLMIAPMMLDGLRIRFANEPASKPYIRMTIDLMQKMGAEVQWKENTILVLPGKYNCIEQKVEKDWSSAAFWFEICALSKSITIDIPDLTLDSIQGDAALAEIMKQFNVKVTAVDSGLRIEKFQSLSQNEIVKVDCSNIPDLVPSLVCTCAGLCVEAFFSGVRILRLKESDRILALQMELKKLSVAMSYDEHQDILHLKQGTIKPISGILNSHNDHRIAMALAPLSLVCGPITLDDGDVVAKSYPEYWNHLRKAGFKVEAV